MERRVMEAIGYPGDDYQFIVSLAWVIAMLAASMLLGMMLAVACFFFKRRYRATAARVNGVHRTTP